MYCHIACAVTKCQKHGLPQNASANGEAKHCFLQLKRREFGVKRTNLKWSRLFQISSEGRLADISTICIFSMS